MVVLFVSAATALLAKIPTLDKVLLLLGSELVDKNGDGGLLSGVVCESGGTGGEDENRLVIFPHLGTDPLAHPLPLAFRHFVKAIEHNQGRTTGEQIFCPLGWRGEGMVFR